MRKIAICIVGSVLVLTTMSSAQSVVKEFSGTHEGSVWELVGANPHLIGGYGDNFNYSGDKVTMLSGDARILVNAEEDIGLMVATVNGTINPEQGITYTGKIQLVYKVLPTEGPAFYEGGVADFIYLHGDTQQAPPVMPTLRAFLASWAIVDIYVDDKLIYKDLDGHMMYTERVRDLETHAIYANEAKSEFYNPEEPGKSYITDPEGRELHFVAHSTDEDPDNFPPNSVWIHLNFVEAEMIR